MDKPSITHRLLSRRRFLGVSTAAAGLALGPGLALPNIQPFGGGSRFVEPPARYSRKGVLSTTLRAAYVPTYVAGRVGRMVVYEGSYPGPTLNVKGGDTLRIRLINDLDEPTNLHTHGLHISPSGNSDNIFLDVPPGETFDYEYRIPANHPEGLCWYHPHNHGNSEIQVYSGLAGLLQIDGELDEVPGVAGVPIRLLVLHATEIDSRGALVPFAKSTHDKYIRTVNGQLNPTLTIRPGETQRWKLANLSADTFMRIFLEGHTLNVITNDNNTLDSVHPVQQIVLGPGERREVLIQGGDAGRYRLWTLEFNGGETGAQEPNVVLATLISTGRPVEPIPLPTTLLPRTGDREDLRFAPVDRYRRITFDYPDSPTFIAAVDGRPFDMNRIDEIANLGATEEWEVVNTTGDWHPFHIHVNPYQVVAINGEPVDFGGYEDTTPVPPYGSITMRTRFLDFPGRFVFHCHILGHEDAGMMAVIEVRENGQPLTVSQIMGGYGKNAMNGFLCDFGDTTGF